MRSPLLPLALPLLLAFCGGAPEPDQTASESQPSAYEAEAKAEEAAPEPVAEQAAAPADGCDPSYPDNCIPPPPPDLDCDDVEGKKPFTVRRPDPHNFDRDGDGKACEPNPRRRR